MLDFFILLGLILINGIFSMSEIALVSTKRMRLQQQANLGSKKADVALRLVDNPSRSLSTLQIAMTVIGIFLGAFGETSFVQRLVPLFEEIDLISAYAYQIALIIVVIAITLITLIFGELVPKRIAMQYPEQTITIISIPMATFAKVMTPIVAFLSFVTETLLKIMRLNTNKANQLTEEDISGMLQEGATSGLFEKTEHDIVARALQLDDKHIATLMTPRNDIHYIDLNVSLEENLMLIADSNYSRFPVCEGGLDNIIGIIDAGALFEQQIRGKPIDFRALAKPAKFVPETISAMDLIETLQEQRAEIAIVINEYGELEGVVTLRDILKVLVGYIIPVNEAENSDFVQRHDGSWLVDGGVTLDRFREVFNLNIVFPGEEEEHYHTLAGFILHQLGRIPTEADTFEWLGISFEVVDMDKHRIDRILVTLPVIVNTDNIEIDADTTGFEKVEEQFK